MGLFKMYKLTVRNNFLQNINLNSFFFFLVRNLLIIISLKVIIEIINIHKWFK